MNFKTLVPGAGGAAAVAADALLVIVGGDPDHAHLPVQDDEEAVAPRPLSHDHLASFYILDLQVDADAP